MCPREFADIPISRRRLVASGAASFVASVGLGVAQTVPSVPPPVSLATEVSGQNLLTIGVAINGRGPFQFVVDTGADRSAIADNVAAALGLSMGPSVMVEGVVRTVRASSSRMDRLSVGPIERHDLDVPVLPRQQLLADGYLGLDVIDGYKVTMDFRNKKLVITEPRHAQLLGWVPPNEIPVRVSGHFGHLRSVNCIVDGVHAVAFVDSGAEISVGNPELYQQLLQQDPSHAQQETVPLTGVTGGVIQSRVTTVRNTKLNGIAFEQAKIAIADLQIFRLWEISDRPALLVGMNWLRQFSRVSIDYARKELRFDLSSRANAAHVI